MLGSAVTKTGLSHAVRLQGITDRQVQTGAVWIAVLFMSLISASLKCQMKDPSACGSLCLKWWIMILLCFAADARSNFRRTLDEHWMHTLNKQ